MMANTIFSHVLRTMQNKSHVMSFIASDRESEQNGRKKEI